MYNGTMLNTNHIKILVSWVLLRDYKATSQRNRCLKSLAIYTTRVLLPAPLFCLLFS